MFEEGINWRQNDTGVKKSYGLVWFLSRQKQIMWKKKT